ncbi:uncharacterized protein [Apostichopus japonicus]|uniref:uncharacterized protein n=1 Tax=Stichopus japonicus TaxID=307972 RepID=UPI003AB7047C
MGIKQNSHDLITPKYATYESRRRRPFYCDNVFPRNIPLCAMLQGETNLDNMTENITGNFIEAYMVLKLADFGVDRPDRLGLNIHAASSVGSEICPYHTTLYSTEKDAMVRAILVELDLLDTLTNLHISKHTLLETFLYIADTLFEDDDVSWWKIVTLVDCSAQMAVMCVDRELPNMVESLLSWTSMIMEKDNVQSWIEENGGWKFLTNRMKSYLQTQAV